MTQIEVLKSFITSSVFATFTEEAQQEMLAKLESLQHEKAKQEKEAMLSALENAVRPVLQSAGMDVSLSLVYSASNDTLTIEEHRAGEPAQSPTSVVLEQTVKEVVEVPAKTIEEVIVKKQYKNRNDLEDFVVPNSVKSIGEQAFFNCANLSRIEISNSVTGIGRNAFYGCRSLKCFTLEPNSPHFLCDDGILFSKGKAKLIAYPPGRDSVFYTIPKHVTTIGESAFASNKNLEQVTIPETVEAIGRGAFLGCDNLKSIIIPGSVRTLGSSAFHHCCELASVTISENVVKLNDRVFADCKKLREVHCKIKNIKDITVDQNVFGDSNLSECTLYVPEGTENTYRQHSVFAKFKEIMTVSYADIEYSEDGKVLVRAQNVGKDFEVPGTVNIIGTGAFEDCTELTSIHLPGSVKHIEKNAFLGCTNLRFVVFSTNLQTIGLGAFENCENLTSIQIPDSVVAIGSEAFKNCTKLSIVVLPKYLRRIYANVFEGCRIKKLHCRMTTLTGENVCIIPGAFINLEKYTLLVPRGYKKIYEDCGFFKKATIIWEE